MNETETRAELIDPALKDAGWDVIEGSCAHREYSHAFPAKMVIERTQLFTENGNKPNGLGPIDPNLFSPYPKNPAIARVFKEIGWADELGSGVRNLFKFGRSFGGFDPELIEGDVFRLVLPLSDVTKSDEQATEQATEQADRLIEFCSEPRTRDEMMAHIGIKHREYFRSAILQPLLDKGTIMMTQPDKPTSPKQRYVVRAKNNGAKR